MNLIEDVASHPLLINRWAPTQTEGVGAEALLPPVTHHGATPRIGPVPSPGQHANDILRELGFDDDHIGDLRGRGVV